MILDQLPDEREGNTKPGRHKLTIKECQPTVTKNGCKALTFEYSVDDSDKFTIKYDNCIIYLADGSDCNFGQYKLKRIMLATEVLPKGEFTIKSVAPLLKGKSFSAELVLDKNDKYLILGDAKTFTKVEETEQNQEKEDSIFANDSVSVDDDSNW